MTDFHPLFFFQTLGCRLRPIPILQQPPAQSPVTSLDKRLVNSTCALSDSRTWLTLLGCTRTDYWAALEKEKAASTPNKQWLWSTTPFETAAAAPPPPPSGAPSASSSRNGSGPPSASTSRSATPGGAAAGPNKSMLAPAANINSKPAPMPKYWLEAPEVRMPTALRDLVERTIRDSMPDLTDADLLMMGNGYGDGSNNAALDDHADAVENSPAGTATPVSGAGWTADERIVEQEFLAQGFRKGHVSRAIAYARSSAATTTTTAAAGAALPLSTLRHEVLSHLHLLVPESDLPAAFQSSKPSDTTIRNATAKNRDELGRMWKAEKVAREVGTPVEWVVAELDKIRPLLPEGDVERKEEEASSSLLSESEIEGRLLEVLARRMMDVEATTDDAYVRRKLGEDQLRAAWASSTPESPAADPELRQRREDELVGLEGVFGARYSRKKDGFEIAIPSSGKSDAIALRILFHPSSRYPSPQEDEATDLPAALPAFYITSPTLPPYIRLHLVYLLSSSFVPSSPVSTNGGAWLELVDAGYGGVVGEMVAFLEEHARSVIDNPPDARTVMDRLLPASQRTGALLAANVAQKVTKAANGGNLRNGRRSRKLRATPEEQAALKRSYEALQQTPEYGKMLQQRQRLPAWGMRDQIVDLIRKSRVTIVCGETGSGKTTQGALVRLLTSSWRTRECSLCFPN